MKFLKYVLAISAVMSFNVNAAVIGGNLLNNAGANQLESWLGQGSVDFTNVWSGTAGDTATDWHSAVDGVGATVSIYDITYNNQNYLIGGYTDTDWGVYGYQSDSDAFIFNLTSGFAKDVSTGSTSVYATYSNSYYFATFGGGHDIYGGNTTLGGAYNGYVWPGHSYGEPLYNGNIIDGAGIFTYVQVNGLESYTISAASVPEPSTVLLMGVGLLGLLTASRKKLVK